MTTLTSQGPATRGVPVGVRTHLAHAALQVIAQEARVQVLHVKGPAVDPSLGRPLRSATDADVVVRPTQVGRYVEALADHGWEHVTSFATGSVFEHAATFYHPSWGYADVHRVFPGMTATQAFAVLWADRRLQAVAGLPCPVPSLTAQRLLLLLHVARNGSGSLDPDYERAWVRADAAERARIRRLAVSVGAQVGLAAALGELDRYAADPAHDLWFVLAHGGTSRLEEWRARFRAAPGPAAKTRVVARSLLVNTDHLAMRLGRRPSHGEVAAEFAGRLTRAVGEARTFLHRTDHERRQT